MTFIPQPVAELIYNGMPIFGDVSPDLLDMTWTDHLHGKADELAVRLQDKDGKWRGPWRPEKGDRVAARLGRRGTGLIDCGEFIVDIPEARGSRADEQLSFRAVSADPAKALRTRRSEVDEDTDLRKVITKRAGRAGFGVSGEIDEVPFKHVRQRRETDLGFIRRMAEDYNHFVSIKSGQLVFYPRRVLEQQGPVFTFEIAPGNGMTDWSACEQEHGTYSKAKVRHLHADKKKVIEAEADDGDVTNGDTLAIDEYVEDEGQAKKLAEGRLAKANENKRTAQLTVVGEPWLVAGNVVALGATFGQYAGRYLIHTATHPVKRASWTVKLDLKGV